MSDEREGEGEMADCSKVSKETWLKLEQSTGHLNYAISGYEKALVQIERFENVVGAVKKHDGDVLKKIHLRVKASHENFEKIKQKTEEEFTAIVKSMSERLRSTESPVHSKRSETDGHQVVKFDDLMEKFKKMMRTLHEVQQYSHQTQQMVVRARYEQRAFNEIREKLDELRFRWTMAEISMLLMNSVTPNEPIYQLFCLPALLTCLIFRSTTSEFHSVQLTKLNKKILRFINDFLKKTNQLSPLCISIDEIVKLGSSFVPNRGQFKIKLDLKLLGRKEQEKKPSNESLSSPASPAQLSHGEVTAPPANVLQPIAKDSQISLASKQSPLPCLENGEAVAPKTKVELIAKDSMHNVSSSEKSSEK